MYSPFLRGAKGTQITLRAVVSRILWAFVILSTDLFSLSFRSVFLGTRLTLRRASVESRADHSSGMSILHLSFVPFHPSNLLSNSQDEYGNAHFHKSIIFNNFVSYVTLACCNDIKTFLDCTSFQLTTKWRTNRLMRRATSGSAPRSAALDQTDRFL